jgi:hypothetical protein
MHILCNAEQGNEDGNEMRGMWMTQAQNTKFIGTKYRFPVHYSELNDIMM